MAASEHVFLRGMSSATYGLKESRAAQLSAPLLSRQNRLFNQLGYNNVTYLDDAAEQG